MQGLNFIEVRSALFTPILPSTCDSKRRSKTSQRTYSPYWNQHFEFQPIDEGLLSGIKLELSLWSHHWIHKDLLVGQVRELCIVKLFPNPNHLLSPVL